MNSGHAVARGNLQAQLLRQSRRSENAQGGVGAGLVW